MECKYFTAGGVKFETKQSFSVEFITNYQDNKYSADFISMPTYEENDSFILVVGSFAC